MKSIYLSQKQPISNMNKLSSVEIELQAFMAKMCKNTFDNYNTLVDIQ